MRLALREATPQTLAAATTLAAALLPLAVYVSTCSAHAYWLDSPEFVAAAADLDIPHPPGHPLVALWGKLFALLPFGPLPFRVAVGQAVAAAIALAALQRASAATLESAGLDRLAPRLLISLGVTLSLAASHAFWFQSVRPEVYALQAALVCGAFERCTAYLRSGDLRQMYLAAFALALGLANHHLVGFLAFPAAFGLLSRAPNARNLRSIGWLALCFACGLSTYVYLPLRASREPPMDLGHPVSWQSLFWVVSARAYAHSFGSDAPQPLAERLADLMVILVQNLTPLVLVLALLGAYALLRARRTWPVAYLWLCAALCNLLARAWLGPVRSNPDMLGYMMPGMAALSALAAAGAGALFAQLPATRPLRALTLGLCLAGLGLSVTRALALRPENDLAAFHATEPFDALRRRDLPPRSIVFLTTPQASFLHWGGAACDALRPDVLMVPVPFLNYGERGELLARQHPELARSIADYLRERHLSVVALSELARTRPVFVEADLSVSLSLTPQLTPHGLLQRLHPQPVTEQELARALEAQARDYARLYGALGADLHESETRAQLLWLHYVDAVQLALRRRPQPALQALHAARALFPSERTLLRLERELSQQGAALDVAPYLMHLRGEP